jgi:hypothetical protein
VLCYEFFATSVIFVMKCETNISIITINGSGFDICFFKKSENVCA